VFYLGLDLGQRQDHAAFAIVERREPVVASFHHLAWREERAYERRTLAVRQVERMRLGTPYREVVRRVAEAARHPRLAGRVEIVMDATGLGQPVVEMMAEAKPGCGVTPVTITGGAAEHHDGRVWHVPKLELMMGLRALLEMEELTISRKMAGVDLLVRELASVKREGKKVESKGHDDLVAALALACWRGRRGTVGEKGVRLFW